jgi:oligopeptide/dipeptide ABC transporter ATP-binding protein
MDQVIAAPAHPYTQLLLASVPSHNPRQRWADQRGPDAVEASELAFAPDACVFVSRCPHVMTHCHEQRPADLPITEQHAAACFLHGDHVFPKTELA